ncbi:MAG: Gmad2 immunoglobulin-like domain-containing protein [Patescibacteria group bacterium]
MNKFFYGTLPLFVTLAIFGFGCQQNPVNQPQTQQPQPVATSTEPQVKNSPANPIDNRYENQKTLTQVSFEGDRTVVRKPFVTNPFVFYGTTTVFENQFAWRVKDDKGTVVAGGRAYANSPDAGQPGPFKIKAFFDKLPQTKEGVFELYDESPKDGSDIILIDVPVTFVDLEPQEVTVYFGNKVKNPEMLDCSKVYAVKRETVAARQPEEVSVHQLLLGPTASEKKAGYFTSLPEGVNDPAIHWEDEGLVVNFDSTLEQGMGGSCRVAAVRAQIEKTVGLSCLKGACIIAVDGRTDDILQP